MKKIKSFWERLFGTGKNTQEASGSMEEPDCTMPVKEWIPEENALLEEDCERTIAQPAFGTTECLRMDSQKDDEKTIAQPAFSTTQCLRKDSQEDGEKTIAQTGGFMECCAGSYKGAVIPVEGVIVIGRDESCCNLIVKGTQISRKHCQVSYSREKGGYFVTDYSANGIFYKNGQPFPKDTLVFCAPGTVFVIAQSGDEFLLR